ncbi:MAG: hypothetical protein A3E53_03910 [Gammaproteobacteria bacterium RIFCSPHIGHO2_12_FULL_39_24]|nr:MAG: hypothetical protein A3E53_03910 [Gammaproteobacteria bacterium RIFCSPHIGHO2_12_FULL_39_24]
MSAYVTCVFCANSIEAQFYTTISWEELTSSWFRCPSCNSLMILPSPDEACLNRLYGENYREQVLQPHPGVDNRVRYSESYRPVVFSEYQQSLDDLNAFNPSPNTLLDFGCADGVFLEFCRQHVFEKKNIRIYGVDISSEMLEVAKSKGFNVAHVNDVEQFNEKFDLITMWDVLEHIIDPYSVLKKLVDVLSLDGRIIIQTPQFGVIAEIFGSNWNHLLPCQHVSLPSFQGIDALAKRLGLVVKKHLSFGANAPESHVQQPFKSYFDAVAKQLNIGSTQLICLARS